MTHICAHFLLALRLWGHAEEALLYEFHKGGGPEVRSEDFDLIIEPEALIKSGSVGGSVV